MGGPEGGGERDYYELGDPPTPYVVIEENHYELGDPPTPYVVTDPEIGEAYPPPAPEVINEGADAQMGDTEDRLDLMSAIGSATEYQSFPLSGSDVLKQDKLSSAYVVEVIGSVDVTSYSSVEKSDDWYRKVNDATTLLLAVYRNNRQALSPGAIGFIERNLSGLEGLESNPPANHADFQALGASMPGVDFYGPEGVFNLLLAFKRVTSKLDGPLLQNLGSSETSLSFKIDLKNRDTRSVEVALYDPEIRQPNVREVKFDYTGLQVAKRMRLDGAYEVEYSHTQTSSGMREIAVVLIIWPQTQIVEVVRYDQGQFLYKTPLPFQTFDQQVAANPYFLH